MKLDIFISTKVLLEARQSAFISLFSMETLLYNQLAGLSSFEPWRFNRASKMAVQLRRIRCARCMFL